SDRSAVQADLAPLALEEVPAPRVVRARHGFVLSRLRFDLKGLSRVLKVLSDGEQRTVPGLLIGECEYARLRVRRPDAARKAHVEADGSFRVPGLSPGPLSLSVLRQGRVPVVTEWFTV